MSGRWILALLCMSAYASLVVAYATILLLASGSIQAQEQATETSPEGRQDSSDGAPSPDFEPAGKYALEIDGEAAPDARVYLSIAAGSTLLVDAPELTSPLLLQPQGKRLEQVSRTDLQQRDGGALALAPGAELEAAGTYDIEGVSLVWSDGERRMRLLERPMLGLHDAAAVATWDPEYARRASRYSPSDSTLQALRKTGGTARVRVYFGTWCPRCGQAVPRLLRLDSELEGSGLSFEYFGMPRLEEDATDDFWREANAAGAYDDEVTIVPLAVIYREGRRIGRITAGWGNPERELEKILATGEPD